jgi:hypothetical protein
MRLACRGCRQLLALAALATVGGGCSAKPAQFDLRDSASPLRLAAAIALPDVRGRIDHMAFDTKSDHLFVAELGNGSVDDVDLKSGTIAGRIAGRGNGGGGAKGNRTEQQDRSGHHSATPPVSRELSSRANLGRRGRALNRMRRSNAYERLREFGAIV